METNKELATAANTLPAVAPEDTAWGSENVDASDILIPKLLCAQAISEAVVMGDIPLGALYESVDKTVLAAYSAKDSAKTEDLEVIAFSNFKSWVITVDKEYEGTYPFTAENANWEREEEVEGKMIVRDLVNSFFVILPKEIVEMGVDGAFPYVLPLKRSSYKAGQKISTTATKLAKRSKPIASVVFKLSRTMGEHKESKGKYFIVDATFERQATKEELQVAYNWYKTLQEKADNIKVDDSDETGETFNNPSASPASSSEDMDNTQF